MKASSRPRTLLLLLPPPRTALARMDVLKKVSAAVLGNPVVREYELGAQVGTAGAWRIHDAVKRGSRQVRRRRHCSRRRRRGPR